MLVLSSNCRQGVIAFRDDYIIYASHFTRISACVYTLRLTFLKVHLQYTEKSSNKLR